MPITPRRFGQAALLILALAYLFFSPCASNDVTIINGTGHRIAVVLRMNDKAVWAGEVAALSERNPPVMHPGGEASFDIEVNVAAKGTRLRGEYGYVLPFDGYRHIFLIDHDGIHDATLSFGLNWWAVLLQGVIYLWGPYVAKIPCAGPDWL
ncbi:MAG: hypothetical protein GY791_08410 [Alphaproteobacteria bacterium]|nr:hypothetical protein [Alphaproteobacteria bacterium]